MMFGLFGKTFAPQIRRLGVEDGADCAALHASAFAFPWPQGDIEALLMARTTVADGAFGSKTNDLQGFILCRLAADEGEILTIAVAPRKRRKGLAARLLGASIARLSALGAKSLFLEVEAENTAARALYKRFGFEVVGERKSYYRKADGTTALAYILRRPVV
jgi:ribosomal-protein-alanine N-acetyltransferase